MVLKKNKRIKQQLYSKNPRKIQLDHRKIRNELKYFYKNFDNFLKSEIIFKLIKTTQISRKKIKNSRSQNEILKKIQKI